MNLAFSKMKKLFRKFGQKQYTFDDFLNIAKRARITIEYKKLPDSVRGYYISEVRRVYRKKCIIFNDALTPEERLYVAFHELAHHFLHSNIMTKERFNCPAKRLIDSAQDAEADAVALVMILPAQKLIEMMNTPFEEIRGYSIENLIARQRIFEKDDFDIMGKKFLPFYFH